MPKKGKTSIYPRYPKEINKGIKSEIKEKKNKKVITDTSDEEDDSDNENFKKNKTQNKKEEDVNSFNSLSTINKTIEIQEKPLKQKFNPPEEYDNLNSKSKPKYSKNKSKEKEKEKSKEKRKGKNKYPSMNKTQSVVKRRRNQNGYNNIISFENPFSEEFEDSYIEEEKNKKKRGKSRNTINDINVEENIWKTYEYTQQSKLGEDYLPCRENEQKKIYDYIQEGLQTNGNYNSLYIAGMPGTGKTVCVKTVINIIESENLKNQKKKSKKINCVPFNKLFLCGTEYPTISNIYKTIYNFIFSSKKKCGYKKCIGLLNEFFSNRNNFEKSYLNDPSNSHIILVIDEIDFLINKNQNFLYNIFNWTTYEGAKLIVISISNTLDLPNHLSPKIKSRMGNNKMMFKPYNKDELITIIKSKGIEFQNFTQDAIKLSCMKVAAINGDLRRIIQILTRAKEIFNLEEKKGQNKTIDKNYIINACEDLFNSKLAKIFKYLQISEKIIICSILSRIKDTNDNKIKITDLYDKKDIFINKYNENIKDNKKNKLSIYWDEYQKIIYNLMRIQLINYCEKDKVNFMENSITIKFYTDEFINACSKDEDLKPVLDYLTNLISI